MRFSNSRFLVTSIHKDFYSQFNKMLLQMHPVYLTFKNTLCCEPQQRAWFCTVGLGMSLGCWPQHRKRFCIVDHNLEYYSVLRATARKLFYASGHKAENDFAPWTATLKMILGWGPQSRKWFYDAEYVSACRPQWRCMYCMYCNPPLRTIIQNLVI